jgi:hypothetical protein
MIEPAAHLSGNRTMALVDIENPTVIHDQRLLGLFRFWHGRLNGRRVPAGDAFARADLARWADNLMMIDVPGDIADFRIRWLGTNLAAMFGTPRAGTGIEAMTSVGERSSVLRNTASSSIPECPPITRPRSSSASAGWWRSRS